MNVWFIYKSSIEDSIFTINEEHSRITSKATIQITQTGNISKSGLRGEKREKGKVREKASKIFSSRIGACFGQSYNTKCLFKKKKTTSHPLRILTSNIISQGKKRDNQRNNSWCYTIILRGKLSPFKEHTRINMVPLMFFDVEQL